MTDRSRHDELRAPQSWCGTNDCPPDDRCDVCALLDELAAAELERDLAVERAKDDKLVADSARRAAKRAARLPKTGMISAVQKVVQLQDALAAAEARAADAEHGRELARLDTEREREDTAAERARADRLTQALERIACGEYADTAEDAARAALAAQPDGTPCHITTLDDITTGRYLITTIKGTRHLVDLDRHTAVRLGAEGREWQEGQDMGFGPVTGDGRPFRFLRIRDATVGKRMRLDSWDEWRLTSQVAMIVAYEDGPP